MTAMAKRKQQVKRTTKYQCRDCANSYDWNSRALDGHLILCRCPFKQDGGRFCIFLSDPACEDHFKLRTDGKDRQMGA